MSDRLVVFYSWGDNTKAVAKYISEITGADILELKVRDYSQSFKNLFT